MLRKPKQPTNIVNEDELSSTNSTIKKPWSASEDSKLRELVGIHGTGNWTNVAEYLTERSGKQCRERWHNHLNPGIKKVFS
jgi:hypothetical protein